MIIGAVLLKGTVQQECPKLVQSLDSMYMYRKATHLTLTLMYYGETRPFVGMSAITAHSKMTFSTFNDNKNII